MVDGNIITGLTAYDIGRNSYLPGGVGGIYGRNTLPTGISQFVYLKVEADLSALGGGYTDGYTVYVPCYFAPPPP